MQRDEHRRSELFTGTWLPPSALVLGTTSVVAGGTLLGILPELVLASVGALVAAFALTRPRFAMMVYAASIPLQEAVLISGPLRNIAKVLGILFVIAYTAHRRGSIRLDTLPVWAWLWLAWTTASLLWGDTIHLSEVFSLLQLFAITLLIADFARQSTSRLTLNSLWAFSIGSAITALITVYRYQISGPIQINARFSAFDTQGVADVGTYMAIAIIFGLIRLIETDRAVRMSERIAAAGVVSVCTVAMFLSGTRTAWLAVGLALIFVLPIARTKALVRLAAASVVVVVAVSSLPQLVPMMDLRVSTAISSGGAGRVSIWADGIAIIERHPLAGVGFGGFPNAFAAQELGYEFDSLVPFTFGGIGRNPHSIYIRVLAETGLIGLILWLLFVGKLIAQSARRGIPSYLNLVMVVLMIVGVFQDVLLSKVFWLPLAYFAGLGASAHERPRVSEDEGNIWPGAKIS